MNFCKNTIKSGIGKVKIVKNMHELGLKHVLFTI